MHNFLQIEYRNLKIQMIRNQQQSYKQTFLHIPIVAYYIEHIQAYYIIIIWMHSDCVWPFYLNNLNLLLSMRNIR